MTYIFKPAVRERTSLLIGIAGPSGAGKTYSALELGSGLAGPKGRIAFIDTEAGRALHYADRFKFDHLDLMAPFRPEHYIGAIKAAEEAGYDVVVIDSMSHEYEGEGGIMEWADQIERDGTKSPGNWKIPKTAHKKMVNRMLQCRAHLIFCLRAEEKIKIEKVTDERTGRTATAVTQAGWQPICEKRFPYELTCSFLVLPDNPGVPVPLKLQEQHRSAFPEGAKISRDAGEALSVWAHGGAVPDRKSSLVHSGRVHADEGMDALKTWFLGLPKADQLLIKSDLDATLKPIADQVDADRTFGSSGGKSEGADLFGDATSKAAAQAEDGSPDWYVDKLIELLPAQDTAAMIDHLLGVNADHIKGVSDEKRAALDAAVEARKSELEKAA